MASVAPVQLESYRATDLLQGSTNYRTWKFSVRMTLLARDLWDVVEVMKSDDAPADWDKRAAKVLAVIALESESVGGGTTTYHRLQDPEGSLGYLGEVV